MWHHHHKSMHLVIKSLAHKWIPTVIIQQLFRYICMYMHPYTYIHNLHMLRHVNASVSGSLKVLKSLRPPCFAKFSVILRNVVSGIVCICQRLVLWLPQTFVLLLVLRVLSCCANSSQWPIFHSKERHSVTICFSCKHKAIPLLKVMLS